MWLKRAWHAAAAHSVGSRPARQVATAAELSVLHDATRRPALAGATEMVHWLWRFRGQMVRPLREKDIRTGSHLLRWRGFPYDLFHLRIQRAAELLANKVAKRALVACVLLRGWGEEFIILPAVRRVFDHLADNG